MKTAVVYYSLDGNCAFVADQIKTELKADFANARKNSGEVKRQISDWVKGITSETLSPR